MKTKKFNKKLTLRKESIANLNVGELQGIQGGTGDTRILVCLSCHNEPSSCCDDTFIQTCPC